MKILIAQPIHEKAVEQLKREIKENREIDMVVFPEGYLSDENALEDACSLAKEYKVTIATSYRCNNKDRAVIINNLGEKILERDKTLPADEIELKGPIIVEHNGITIGYVLCMEILKAVRDLKRINEPIDLIVHPIGVGMFSEDQFNLWINEAKKVAKAYGTTIIGTSHADGSYRNCGISIPISYCIDSQGEVIYISKADTRTRIVDLATRQVKVN